MDERLQEEKKIEGQVSSLISQDRVLNFSDAVFAFAATLLVLKIDLPEIAIHQLNTNFIGVFETLWPQYVANIISFLIIGYYWLNHHAIFSMIKKYNATVVWINLIFLIFVSFLPFPVDLYGDFFMVPIVVMFYSASLAVVGYLLAIIWWYASANFRLINSNLGKKHAQYYLARILVAPIVFTLAIPLVAIHPIFAQASWFFVVIGILIVNKLFAQTRISEIEKLSL